MSATDLTLSDSTASPSQLRDKAAVLAVHGYYSAVATRAAVSTPSVRVLDRYSFSLMEQMAEAVYYAEFQPLLFRLYTAPLDEEEMREAYNSGRLRSFLRAYYRRNPAIPVQMREVLYRRGLSIFDMGGQYALDSLGLNGGFHLTDEVLLGELQEHSRQETIVGGNMSLIDTTINELATELDQQRENDRRWEFVLAAISGWALARAIIRTAVIVQTESVRHSRWAMLSAMVGNGIGAVRYYTTEDERVCELCRPLHGTEYHVRSVFHPLNDIPSHASIPIHPKCRCFYDAIMDGWVKPALIWTGFALAGRS